MKYSTWLVGNSIDVTELKTEGNSENWELSIKYLILKIKFKWQNLQEKKVFKNKNKNY